MSERFGDQSVAKRLFKFELVFFLSFFTFTALSCHMSQIGTFLPSTKTKVLIAKYCDFSYWEDLFIVVLCYLFSVLNSFSELTSNILPVTWFGFVYGEDRKSVV